MSLASAELKPSESSPASASSPGSAHESRFSNLRSVQWRINLGLLPPPSSVDDLRRTAADSRRKYARLRRCLLIDPHFPKDEEKKASNVVMDNPLSQNPDSTWSRFFRSAELERIVDQDLSRLYPEHSNYFQTSACQAMLRRILLLWCLRHPEYGYSQGMHELLAPLLYVLQVDVQHLSRIRELYEDHFYDKFDDICDLERNSAYAYNFSMTSSPISSKGIDNDGMKSIRETAAAINDLDALDPSVKTTISLCDPYGAEGELGVLLSERFMEHDAYCMFDALMSGSGGAIAMVDFYSPSPAKSLSGTPPIIEASSALYHLLAAVDSSLHYHLVELEVEPQYFALRWLRVLFGREFSLRDLLIIWDEIFASSNAKSMLGLEDSFHANNLMLLSSPRGAFIAAVAVAMLLHVRSSLLATENTTMCLQRLVNFPENVDVERLIHKAKSLQTLVLDSGSFPSPVVQNGSRNTRCLSLPSGSVSPKGQPSSLLESDSYWEEKWRVLHSSAEFQGSPSDPLSTGIDAPRKEKLKIKRRESAPPALKFLVRKNDSRTSVRRRLLEDLSRELGNEINSEMSGCSEIVGLSEDKKSLDGTLEDKDAKSSICTSEDVCLSEPAATTEENSVCSISTSPGSFVNDHGNDLEKSSIDSNSSMEENNDENINNGEKCSILPDESPSSCSPPNNVILKSHELGNGRVERATDTRERKPVSLRFQWLWKFGRSSEGNIEKGVQEAQGRTNVGVQNEVKCASPKNCGQLFVTRSADDAADNNVMVTLKNLGQTMLENIQVLESVFQQDHGQVGSLENFSRNILGGKGPATALSALKELRKISSLLTEM